MVSTTPGRAWRSAAASALAYLGIALAMGRDGVGMLGTRIFSDAGDPVLVAAILAWNARHLPWTQAWWNFPAFHPLPDTLAFSENLLGLSIIAAPVQWLTGNPVVTYNLMLLLSFPFCALAMYALVYRLTRTPSAAFVAGLAYGFAPYRIAHLPHLQLLAAFWMPLSLLGLHAFVESRRRRWLLLFAGGWLLQALTNGYYLVFFSLLVGLWVLWFVAAARRWRELWPIVVSAAIASVPLVPTLARYLAVHARHGFARGIDEIQFFSADVAGVFCAPIRLAAWGWLQTGCKPEGELFPGLTTVALCSIAGVLAWRAAPLAPSTKPWKPATLARRVLLIVALFYLAIAIAVWLTGGWRWDLGPVRLSAMHLEKPASIALLCVLAAGAISRRFVAALLGASPLGFYTAAALLTWLLTLGPTPTLMLTRVLHWAPYGVLMNLPGLAGLRVPSRFWMMTVLCLAVTAGLLLASVLKGRSVRVAWLVTIACAFGLLLDGWARWPLDAVPAMVPRPERLAGSIVLELPLGNPGRDVGAVFRAVTGGWRTVNGYSGFEPLYYGILRNASRNEDGSMLEAIRKATAFTVIVPKDAPRLLQIVAQQRGAIAIADGGERVEYRVPRAPDLSLGAPLTIGPITASCATDDIALMTDGDTDTRWTCGFQAENEHEITVDLGRDAPVAAVVTQLGRHADDFPRHLLVTTSRDRKTWEPAWNGDVLDPLLAATMQDPAALPLTVQFAARRARYVRLQRLDQGLAARWSIAELAVRGPNR